MSSDSSSIDTLNFSSFIKNIHGGLDEQNIPTPMLSATNMSEPLFSVTSPSSLSITSISTIEPTPKSYKYVNLFLKIILIILVLYAIYTYIISPSFKKTKVAKSITKISSTLSNRFKPTKPTKSPTKPTKSPVKSPNKNLSPIPSISSSPK